MRDKEFKTLEEQIEILKKRGMIIQNDADLKVFLEENNYYRLSGYFKMYTKPNVFPEEFIDDFSFVKLKNIYYFDSEIRTVVNELLARIEIIIRTQVAYNVAKEKGPYFYKEQNNFNNGYYFGLMKESITKEVEWCPDSNSIIQRYGRDNLPIWALVELLTFGTLSKLYNNLQTYLKKEISNHGCINPINHLILSNHLRVITELRNACSHRVRFYGYKFNSNIELTNKDKELFNKYSYRCPKNSSASLFDILIACFKLIKTQEERKYYIDKFKLCIKNYAEDIDLKYIGFYKNWEELLLNI